MSADSHSFNVELAKMVGLTEALLLQHFYYWHQHARNLPEMLREGRVWFFRSVSEMREVFPYLSDGNVRTAIQHLIDRGLVVKGDFSSNSMYKATWYSLNDSAIQLFDLQKSTNAFAESQNGFAESSKSISNRNKDNRKIIEERDNNTSRFIKPTFEQVRAYCLERQNGIDPRSFVDYYTANGWKVGRNPMRDWQAAVRQWEARRKNETPNPSPFPRQQQQKESVYERNARAFAEFERRLQTQFADEQ